MTYPSIEELVKTLPILMHDEPILTKMTIGKCKTSKAYNLLSEDNKTKIDTFLILNPKKVNKIITLQTGSKKVQIDHAKALKKLNKTGQLYYCQKCFEPNSGDWWYFQNLLNTLIPKNKQVFINQQNSIGDVYITNKSEICLGEPMD